MSRFYIGAMTGTSLDAIDLALCSFEYNNNHYSFELIHYLEIEFPNKLKTKILEMLNHKCHLSEISQLNFAVSKFYSNSIIEFIKQFNISHKDIIAIGMHGQTIWHEPIASVFAGYNISSTFQVGNISAVSQLTGIRTVGDFRSADIALGGNGAPLVPIFDYYMMKGENSRIMLNIGGISNVTILPLNCTLDDVIAFDTGPGNVWIDMTMNELFGENYDRNGETAERGLINQVMLNFLLNRFDFIEKAPPKSTGRELFSKEVFLNILKHFSNIDKFDFLATITEFTAKSISMNIKLYSNKSPEVIVSGGGAKNKYLLKRLSANLEICKVITSNEIGIISDAKEAICFAFLAYLFDNNISGNIPSVTGASKSTVLGLSSKL